MELVGLIAGAFELGAIYLAGSKNKLGFISGLLCNILWITYVLSTGAAYGLLLVCVPALFLNVRGYIRWSKKRESSNMA